MDALAASGLRYNSFHVTPLCSPTRASLLTGRHQERLDDIGGPNSNSDIPWGWSQVGNTPLRWYKQDTHGAACGCP